MNFLAMLISIAMAFPVQPDFIPVQDGEAKVSIVLPENPSKDLQYAASELQDFVFRMSGAKLPVGTDPGVANPIFIGFDADKLEDDQIRIACDGKSLRLSGGGRFGTLQAVYAFLRDQGVFWPFMDEMWLEIPQRKTITVPEQDVTMKPFFSNRAIHSFPKDYDRLFHWMAFNGWKYRSQNPPGYYFLETMLARGIQPRFSSHCWAFWSGRKALNEHIEWNPLLDGKRTPPPLKGPPWWMHSQMCIGNAELRKHVLNNMLEYLKVHPDMKTLPLEANDGGGYCDCELCRAYCENPNDRVFKFASEMAEAIAKVHPDVMILINGYGNHEDPPVFPLPANMNISIRHNDRNYAKPITDPENRVYFERLEKWAKHSPGHVNTAEMGVKVFYKDWLHPFDDILAEDVKTYAELKLNGFFAEGLYPSPLTEYLRSEFCRDPYQDLEKLSMKFCRGLYGEAAAPFMFDYYRLLNRRIRETGKNLDDMGRIAEYVGPIAKEGMALLAQAEKAAAAEPRFLARIRFEKAAFEKLVRTAENWFSCEKDIVTDEIRAANKLSNGGFERDFEDVDRNVVDYPGQGKFKFSIDNDAYQGKKSGCITVVEPGWGRMIMTAKNLDPNKKYAVLAAVKTTDGADMVHIWYGAKGERASLYRMGSTDGKWYRAAFRDITVPQGELSVYLTLHTDPKKGRVLFDDVIIVEQDLLAPR